MGANTAFAGSLRSARPEANSTPSVSTSLTLRSVDSICTRLARSLVCMDAFRLRSTCDSFSWAMARSMRCASALPPKAFCIFPSDSSYLRLCVLSFFTMEKENSTRKKIIK